MESEDLLDLDAVAGGRLEPVGEALVEGRALRLGKGFVGGVPDEDVPEPEGVADGELRPVRAEELLAHQGEQPAAEIRLRIASSPASAATSKLAADDRGPLGDGSLGLREALESGGEERLDRDRDRDVVHARRPGQPPVASARRWPRRGASHELLDVERVALGRLQDPGAERRRDGRAAGKGVEQGIGCVRRSGSRRRTVAASRPSRAGPSLEEVRAGRGEEEQRDARGETDDVVHQIEQGVSAQWRSSRTTMVGCRSARCSTKRRTAQNSSSCGAVSAERPIADATLAGDVGVGDGGLDLPSCTGPGRRPR